MSLFMRLIMKKIFFLILGIALSMTVVMSDAAAAEEKKGPKIRLGEFTGTTDSGTDETKYDSQKGLSDSDIEFMYRAGVFDEPPKFFRQRISVAYNLFYIHNKEHFTYDLVQMGDEKHYSNGIAIQYHCGISLIRYFDWRSNPFLGVNLLLDGSLGSGGAGNIKTLGVGGEVHFLWIFQIGAGLSYIQSENRIFGSGRTQYSAWYGRNIPIKDKKSKTLPFFQGGISIPVSNKYDVFALVRMNYEEEGDDNHTTLTISSCRTGVAWKF